MKITDVQALIVEGNFDWLLVCVDTSDGLRGLGECVSASHSNEIKQLVFSLRDRIVGKDPLNISRLTYEIGLGRTSGYLVNAISGIEIALWDLLGKALNVPIHTLFGGSHREELTIYADCHAGKTVTSKDSYGGGYESYTPEAYSRNAKEIEGKGYSLLKFDFYPNFPGPKGRKIQSPLSNADIQHCADIVRYVRDSLKDQTGIAIDLGGGYSTADAIRLGRAFEPYGLEWIEDVVPGTNVEALSHVTRSISIPVLCSYTQLRNMRQDAREIITEQAARLLAIDFGSIGGLWEGRKIADLAELYFMQMAVHNIASPIGTIAAAQACASIPNFKALEHHAIGVEWWDSLVEGDSVIQKGFYRINNKPGLGVELVDKQIEKHLKEGEQLFS